MKSIKLILFIVCATIGTTFAQTKLTKADKKKAKLAVIKDMIDTQNYDFLAQYANPLGGGHRMLTSDYDIRVKKDSVIAYLPYFGQGYFDIPYNSNDGGIKFTSTKFTYKLTERKKGGWEIVIHPQDVKYMQSIYFYISAEGYASAQFTITNKSAISFDGYLKEPVAKN